MHILYNDIFLLSVYREADGLTPISIAVEKEHKSITEVLVRLTEVDVNKASESGITPLLMIAGVGWTDIPDILLERGAIVDAAPFEHNANTNHQNLQSISALILASEQGYFQCVKLLVASRADLELSPYSKVALELDLCGQTPLFCAAKEGQIDIVKYLLKHGSNPHIQNCYGISAIWTSAQKGMLEILQLLLNAGAETTFHFIAGIDIVD